MTPVMSTPLRVGKFVLITCINYTVEMRTFPEDGFITVSIVLQNCRKSEVSNILEVKNYLKNWQVTTNDTYLIRV